MVPLCALITLANKFLFIQHLNYHVDNVIKQLVHASTCVHRDVKHAGRLESTQEARVALTHLLCSPNLPRASYLDERTLTHEPIVY